MSTTIDEKVVEMRFDNKQFEANVQTSMSTLAKLKQSLNLSAASKGLESIGAAAKNVNLGAIGDAAEVVQAKFSALQVMGMTAISRLTDSAITAGKRIASAFTIDPIKSGFEEYETQINAVQTILANTSHQGTTLGDVNAALDELNKYADKTIYNFTQMTRNVGTFTAAGLDLNTSVEAIKGIANLAAVSGSTSQQASTAMYQLSQALANGRVTLQDWNSVVNAGMGGKVFQDALVRTAAAMEGISEEAFRAQNIVGSFRESISTQNGTGWLTSDVLSQTLRQFTGDMTDAELAAMGFTEAQIQSIQAMGVTANDAATKVKTYTQLMDTLREAAQSGWTQTWELIVGDFEESKTLWTGVSDVLSTILNTSAEARNTMLAGALESNWEKMVHNITDAGISVDVFEKKVKDVMSTYTPAVDELIGMHGSLEKVFTNGAASTKILEEAIKGLSGDMYNLTSIERELGKGFKGDDVKLLQEVLNSKGFDVGKHGVDGIFGKDTLAALEAFQEVNGLEITGILDEATVNLLGESSEKVKSLTSSCGELIDNITELGGRELLIETLKNSFDGLMSVITPIKTAFREIFPPTTSEQLFNILQSLNNFSKRLTVSGETADKIRRTFKGLFAILDIGKQAFGALWNTIKPIFGGLDSLGNAILDTTASLGDWLVTLSNTTRENNTFYVGLQKLIAFIQNGFSKIKEYVKPAIDSIREFMVSMKTKITDSVLQGFNKMTQNVKDGATSISDSFANMKDAVANSIKTMGETIAQSKFVKVLSTIWNTVKTIATGIGKVVKGMFSSLGEQLGEGDFSGVLEIISGVSIGGLAAAMINVYDKISNILSKVDKIGKGVVNILNSVRGCLEAYQDNLRADVLLKIAGALAILTAAVTVLSLLDPGRVGVATAAITALFTELLVAMGVFAKIGSRLDKTTSAVVAMIGMASAVAILAGALTTLSGLNIGQMTVGIIGVMVLLKTVISSTNNITEKDGKKVLLSAVALSVFASAVKKLAKVCAELGSLNLGQVVKGVGGVITLIAAMGIFLNKANLETNVKKTAAGIISIALAIRIMSSACKELGSMNIVELVKGLAGVGGMLAAIALFTNNLKVNQGVNMVSVGAGIVLLATGMRIFASAVGAMGNLPLGQLVKGLAGVSVALAAVTLAVRFMPANMISMGAGLILIGAGLAAVSGAVTIMGSMNLKTLVQGLAGVAVALTEFAIGLNFMKGTIGASAALLVAAAAIAILAPSLILLGAVGWVTVAVGLGALAGALTILGVAGYLLGPVVPVILSLSGALALIGAGALGVGVGLLAAGVGISAFATGLVTLAGLSAASAVAIGAAIKTILTKVVELLPMVIGKIGEGFISLCEVIVNSAPKIKDAFVAVLGSIISAIVESIPMVIRGVFELISGILNALVEYAPKISEAALKLLMTFLKGIADNISLFIQAGVDIVLGFIDGITQSLPKVIQAGFNLLLAFINGVADAISNNGPLLVEAMSNLILSLVDVAISVLTGGIGLFWDIGAKIVNAIGEGIASLWDWFTNTSIGGLITDGITTIKNKLWEWKTAGSNLIANLIDGVKKKFQDMKTAASNLLTTAKEGIVNKFNEWVNAGKDLISGFIDGIKSKVTDVVAAATGVASTALQAANKVLGIASPSKEFAKIGRWSDEGLVVGLKHYAGRVANAAKDVASTALNTMDAAMSGIVDIVDFGVDSEPTIRPVLDLTAVENGAYMLNGLFADPRSLALGADVSIGFGDRTNALASMISDISDGENVVNVIRELRSDVAELAVAMTNMRVVMDTGATVGALEGEIDKRLGIRSGLKGRGN